MATQHYVNSPADEGRKRRENSGQSNVIRVVGVTFGLLCITQAALNIYLRLQGDVKSDLISANVTLATENRDLIDRLSRENKELRDQLQELIKSLNATVNNLESCDSGWTEYKSSCYQLSTSRANRWFAAEDCAAKGAHLMILNNDVVLDVLLRKRRCVWVGLMAVHHYTGTTWLWDNGCQLTTDRTLCLNVNQPNTDCVYAKVQWDGSVVWIPAPCEDHFFWVCEKDRK